MLAARDLFLWALAVLAAAPALLAWQVAAPVAVGAFALLYAVALGLAPWAGALVFVAIDAVGRGRVRILLGLLHGGLVLLAPLVVGAAPGLLPRTALLFAWLQVLTLLLAASEAGALASLANAGALVVLAALHGGLAAAAAVTGFLPLLAAFLVLDHWARSLSAHPRARVPARRVVVGQALGLALPVAVGAAAFFLLVPTRPAESLLVAASRSVRAEPIGAAHRILIFSLLLGGGSILTVVRLFRRDPKRAAPSVEALDVLPLEDEALPAEPAPPEVPHAGARGRILRAYLCFLAVAARRVSRRHPFETAREFARRVGQPARPLRSLTELFMAARYGAEEPTEREALAAEGAANEIRAAWRRLRAR